MTVEQKTFTPQPEELGVTQPISSNGNLSEASIIPEPKPLTSEQMSVINTLKNPVDKFIAQLLVNGRKQRKPVTMVAMEELATSDIPMIINRKPIIHDEEKIDGERIRTLLGRHIFSSLRPKFERVGLSITNNYHTGKKGESSYALKTQEELPSQEELAQYYTLKDLSSAIGEHSPQAVRSRLDSAIRRDPTIKPVYLPDGKKPRVIRLTKDDFEKTIKADIARITIAKNGTNSNKNNIANTQDEKVQNKSTTESVLDKKPSPFADEAEKRAWLGRTPEQVIEELIMHNVNVILSHFARDCIKELDKNLKALLENALPPKIKLDSVIKGSPEQFFMGKLIERLLALWPIVDTKPSDSALQKQAIGYCLEIKQKGYGVRDIVDNTCSHFSIPNPFTSVQEL